MTSGFESSAIRSGRRVFDHAGTAEGGCRHMMPTTHDYKAKRPSAQCGGPLKDPLHYASGCFPAAIACTRLCFTL